MPNEAPYGHGCPPEPFAGKASKYQKHGPESAKQGRGCPPGDKVPKQGIKALAAAKEVTPPSGYKYQKNKDLTTATKASPASGYGISG